MSDAGGFRRKRMALFREIVAPTAASRILDVGGAVDTWAALPIRPRITRLNLETLPRGYRHPENIRYVRGDALRLPFRDGSFDVAFSNSVIEHVGGWPDQQRFAAEINRVAARLWVQTPAREFFLEPHLVTPFVHWLPRRWQRLALRRLTVWGWMTRPSRAEVEAFLKGVRLLGRSEVSALFPGCTIQVETWLGLTKSYIAWR
jgi:hypothetical protein